MSGYIRAWRSLLEKEIFQERPFCPLAAWIWLLMEANYEPKIDRYGDMVERGEIHTSEAALATSWGWTKSRVHRFLLRLESESRVESITNHRRTKLRIANYEQYQGAKSRRESLREPDTESKTNRSANTTERITIQEKKEVPPSEVRTYVPFVDPDSGEHSLTKFVTMTPAEHAKLVATYGAATVSAKLASVDDWMPDAKRKYTDHAAVVRNALRADAAKDRAAQQRAESARRVGTHGTSAPPSKLQQVQQRNAEARARVVAAVDGELPAQLEIGGDE